MQSNWAALQAKLKGGGAKGGVAKGGGGGGAGKGARPRGKSRSKAGGSDAGAGGKKRREDDDRREGGDAVAKAGGKTEKRKKVERAEGYGNGGGLTDAPRRRDAEPAPSIDARGGLLDDVSKLADERIDVLRGSSEIGRIESRDGTDAHLERVYVSVEAARLVAVSNLCFHFEKLAAPVLKRRWANTFEEFMLCHAGGRDPLLPEDHEARDFLLDRLRAAGATPADAQKITALLVNRCREGALRVVRAGSDARRDGDAHDVTLERFEGPGGVPRVRLSACGAEVEIREGHLEKLRKLHGVAAGDSEARKSDETFVRDAFCVLCRYVGAQGGMHRIAGGHHTALHGAVFDVLRDTLGVEVECFASPLNCRWPSFCSGHADVDRPFGSLGSFFRFFPTEGAFECNPPFEESLMLRVAKHLTQLLDASTKLERALTFVVVVPHWPKRPAWEALHAVPYRARAEVIPLREHGYFEGAQHTKKAQYRRSTCDTSIIFMQTPKATETNPVTRDAVDAIRRAFAPRRE